MKDKELYAKNLMSLMDRRTETKNEAHSEYNQGWKHMNKYKFAMKVLAKIESDIDALITKSTGKRIVRKETRAMYSNGKI